MRKKSPETGVTPRLRAAYYAVKWLANGARNPICFFFLLSQQFLTHYLMRDEHMAHTYAQVASKSRGLKRAKPSVTIYAKQMVFIRVRPCITIIIMRPREDAQHARRFSTAVDDVCCGPLRKRRVSRYCSKNVCYICVVIAVCQPNKLIYVWVCIWIDTWICWWWHHNMDLMNNDIPRTMYIQCDSIHFSVEYEEKSNDERTSIFVGKWYFRFVWIGFLMKLFWTSYHSSCSSSSFSMFQFSRKIFILIMCLKS